jgi:hypothetical protein
MCYGHANTNKHCYGYGGDYYTHEYRTSEKESNAY